MKIEIWRNTEYRNVQVSHLGRGRRKFKSHYNILKQSKINNGYLIVTVRNKNHHLGRKRELVHRLVGKAFILGYSPGLEINHKDGTKLKNKYNNLEWCTRLYNIHDTIRRGTHNVTKAQAVAQIKNCRRIAQYDMDDNFIREYHSAKAAIESTGAIKASRVANGQRNSAGGFKWKWILDNDIV